MEGIAIAHSCEGKAVCGTCRVNILKGSFALPQAQTTELLCHEKMKLAPDERLACQIQLKEDIDLEITTSYW